MPIAVALKRSAASCALEHCVCKYACCMFRYVSAVLSDHGNVTYLRLSSKHRAVSRHKLSLFAAHTYILPIVSASTTFALVLRPRARYPFCTRNTCTRAHHTNIYFLEYGDGCGGYDGDVRRPQTLSRVFSVRNTHTLSIERRRAHTHTHTAHITII